LSSVRSSRLIGGFDFIAQCGRCQLYLWSQIGSSWRKVFYSVPWRLIGHQLRVRLYDDRLDLFIGGTPLMTLPRGRAHPSGKHAQVVNYRHLIHALRKKPMALLYLVYRDQLFPREAFRRTFDAFRERLPDRQACRITVDLRSCPTAWCRFGGVVTAFAGMDRAGQAATAGNPTIGSSLKGAIVSSDM